MKYHLGFHLHDGNTGDVKGGAGERYGQVRCFYCYSDCGDTLLLYTAFG